MVIIVITISYLFKFNEYNIATIGHLKRSLPKMMIPPFHIFFNIIEESIDIAIVSMAINISLGKAKTMEKNEEYQTDQVTLLIFKFKDQLIVFFILEIK
jgi:hypothetical protein